MLVHIKNERKSILLLVLNATHRKRKTVQPIMCLLRKPAVQSQHSSAPLEESSGVENFV
jgi:hypothetical protein